MALGKVIAEDPCTVPTVCHWSTHTGYFMTHENEQKFARTSEQICEGLVADAKWPWPTFDLIFKQDLLIFKVCAWNNYLFKLLNYAVEDNEVFNRTLCLFCVVCSLCVGERLSEVPHQSFVSVALFWGGTMGRYFNTEHRRYVFELWRNLCKFFIYCRKVLP